MDELRRTGNRVGVGLPQFRTGGAIPHQEIRSFASSAEGAGFESLWVMDAIFTSASGFDPLSLLAFAAGTTKNVLLGAATIVLPRQNPILLAKALASIDHLSGGRLVVGLSVGEEKEVVAFGVDARRRGAVFEDSFRLMRALWEQDSVDAEEPFRLSGAVMQPKPRQRPLPVFLGGRSVRAIRRAVQLADGWVAGGFASVADFAKLSVAARALLDEAGRDASDFVIGKRVYVSVGRPVAATKEWFRSVYGSEVDGSAGLVAGDVSYCLERLAELRQLGAELLILNPVGDDLDQLEIFGDKLLPNLG